jgi:hypothetical protein
MTAPTTQSREAFEAWIKTLKGYPFAGAFSNLMWLAWQSAIQAGREALLAELRTGGVDLPNFDLLCSTVIIGDTELRVAIQDCGDRRAAALIAQVAELVAAIKKADDCLSAGNDNAALVQVRCAASIASQSHLACVGRTASHATSAAVGHTGEMK